MEGAGVAFQHSMMAINADGATKQSRPPSHVIMVIQCIEEKGMKIEECKVGMKVLVTKPTNGISWNPHGNMDDYDGKVITIEDIESNRIVVPNNAPYKNRINSNRFNWYLKPEWLSPAPDEQEEKIADSSASLDEVMDKLADKAVEESAVNSCLFLMNEAPIVIGVDLAKPSSDETVVWQSARRNGKSWYQEAMFDARAFSRLFDAGSQDADPNTAMLARDEVPEETKQVLTREPKEIPWYSRITPMSERVKVNGVLKDER